MHMSPSDLNVRSSTISDNDALVFLMWISCIMLFAIQGINYAAKYGQTLNSLYPYSSATSSQAVTGTCNTALVSFNTGGGVQPSGSAELITPSNSEIALMEVMPWQIWS
jgi:hypothetical protein